MKKFLLFLLAALLVFAYCSRQNKSDSAPRAQFSEQTQYASLTMEVEIPDAAGDYTDNVREALLNVLFTQCVDVGYGDGDPDVMDYRGENDDTQDIVSHYGKAIISYLDKNARGDAADRAQSGFGVDDDFKWVCELNIQKIYETSQYVVYLSRNYVYMGGAHGGVTGAGYLTFSKEDGMLVENMLDQRYVKAMQPVLYQGVKSYFEKDGDTFDKDYLFIENGLIPFPHLDPCPMGDSILFVYQQYEIAPYAMGMPAFKLPMSLVRDILTPDARMALGLDIEQ